MPESFTGKGDFEDYLQQFNTAALLSGWYSTAHDNRPHYFALRLRDNALHFYTTLSAAQQTNFDQLIDAFRQNYTTNGDILKARLKAAKQQPNQDISAFLCDVRTLARRAYRDTPGLIDPMVMTCFIEGLKDKTLRWELRKAKPATADQALTLAMELNSFLEIERGGAEASQPVNRVSTDDTPASDLMTEFVRTLRQELQRSRPQNSGYGPQGDGRRNNSPSNLRPRSESNDSTKSNPSVRFQSAQNSSNYRNNESGNNKRNRESSPHPSKKRDDKTTESNKKMCDRCKRTNHATKDCKACYNCLKVGHFRRDCTANKKKPLN